jgi:hypothetical protein
MSKKTYYGLNRGGVPTPFDDSTKLDNPYVAVKDGKEFYFLYHDGKTCPRFSAPPTWEKYINTQQWLPFRRNPFTKGKKTYYGYGRTGTPDLFINLGESNQPYVAVNQVNERNVLPSKWYFLNRNGTTSPARAEDWQHFDRYVREGGWLPFSKNPFTKRMKRLTLPSGVSRRGAQMGRQDVMPKDLTIPIKLQMERLKWVDHDYSQFGCYWGGGEGDYIYCAWNAPVYIFVRAKTRQEAKEQVRETIPNARFYN